jgi:rare lipoprotein A
MKTSMWIVLLVACLGAIAEEGDASYYTEESCKREGTSGVYTANGERFNEKAFTCARRSRAWGTEWKVTNLENGRSIIVRQNDFGPGKGPAAKGVIIDLTPTAFEALGGKLKKGKVKVKVELYKEAKKKK